MQVTEDFSTTSKKDSATNADWNTSVGRLQLPIGGYGNGQDGDLYISNGQTVRLHANTDYQFNSLTIEAGGHLQCDSTSGAVMHIRVKGTATINGYIQLNDQLDPGQRSDGVTIDGIYYSSPSVANGGGGGSDIDGHGSGGGQGAGFGGGGCGGNAYFNYNGYGEFYGGSGGGGGTPGGGGGAGGYASWGGDAHGNGGGTSGGGGGACCSARNTNSDQAWGGNGGDAYGNGGNGGGLEDRGAFGGGGGAGGIAGRAGMHLVIKARDLVLGSSAYINTSGTSGGNGGGGTNGGWNSADQTHYLYNGGAGGGGGGGGNAGFVKLYYTNSYNNYGPTWVQNGGGGGSGGGGGLGYAWGGGNPRYSNAGGSGGNGSGNSAYAYGETIYNTSLNVGQSTTLDATALNIPAAILTKSDSVPGGTSITYYLSVDGGSHWEAVTPSVQHNFSYPGSDLRFKIVLSGTSSSTPYVDYVIIDYGQAKSITVDDSFSLSDDVSKGIGVNVADSITLSDSVSKSVGKVVDDSLTLEDDQKMYLNSPGEQRPPTKGIIERTDSYIIPDSADANINSDQLRIAKDLQ